MQTTRAKQAESYNLIITKTGIIQIQPYRWVIDHKAQQRKRRALLTIIFLAYPFLAQ